MRVTRYRVTSHDDAQCDQCGYPMDPGDYGWLDAPRALLFCSPSCAARWERNQNAQRPASARLPDWGGADDQCGHVTSDADPGL
jgi:hypothetical protein